MSTRSNIGIINEDGSVRVVYCHFDGYLTGGVGEQLVNEYNSEGHALDLVNEGNKSSIGSPYEPYEEAAYYPSLEAYKKAVQNDLWIEYAYLWNMKEGRWWFIKGHIYDYRINEPYEGDIPIWLDEAVLLEKEFKNAKV